MPAKVCLSAPIGLLWSRQGWSARGGKKYLLVLSLISSTLYGQLSIKTAKDSTHKYHISSYSYMEQYIDHKGYGAPVILTLDSGAAVFGDGDEGTMLVKLNKSGKNQWTKIISPKGSEMESQAVVQDKNGNFYVFMLVYGTTGYRGGRERCVMLNKTGAILWDKYIGTGLLLNSPTVSYLETLKEGKIALRGQVVKEKQVEGKDPVYLYWEATMDSKGVMIEKTGVVLDWSKPDWKKLYEPK